MTLPTVQQVIWVPVVGGVAGLLYGLWLVFEYLEQAWRQRQIDAIMAENARVSRREQRLKEWRKRDQQDVADVERRMHLVMQSSTRKIH